MGGSEIINTQTYDYASILKLSERAAWKLEEVIREDAAVDMSRPFLPESVFRAEALAGLTPAERLTFNRITGHSYCHLFIMIEEYVVIDALGKAMSRVAGEREAVRAWIRLSDDEAKHQMMFLRFQRAVARQFPCALKTLPGVHELAQQILKHSPLGLMVFVEQAARNPRFLEVLTSLKPEAKQRALALTPTA